MRVAVILLVCSMGGEFAIAGPRGKKKPKAQAPAPNRPEKIEGHVAYPRTRADLDRTLAEIARSPGLTDPQRALRRLRLHRYLAGVSWKNIALERRFNELAQAAAHVGALIGGRPSHAPHNPGVDPAYFEKAKKGAALCNLDFGERTPVECIDEWMYDSLGRNARDVGHRSWCLALRLKTTGFGFAKRGTFLYAAMWARGLNRRRPDVDAAYFPARGYMPLKHFRRNAPWSVHLNPRRFWAPRKWTIEVEVTELDAACRKAGRVPLEFVNVPTEDRGRAPTVVFRPALPPEEDLPGKRYWVEIKGLQRKMSPGAADVEMKYLVEFVGEPARADAGAGTGGKKRKKRTDGEVFGP